MARKLPAQGRRRSSASAGPARSWRNELTDAGLDVVAIERGPWRDTATDFPPDLRAGRAALSHSPRTVPAAGADDLTFRNKMDQTALPIRTWGAFMPPNGVGGGGVHWNAETWRFLPSDFVLQDASDAALRRELPARRT